MSSQMQFTSVHSETLKKIRFYDEQTADHKYKMMSAVVSVLVVGFYTWRYLVLRHTRLTSSKYVVSGVLLAVWNFLMSVFADSLVLRLGAVENYYENMEASARSGSESESEFLASHQFWASDVRSLLVMIEGFVLVKVFLNTGCRMIEHIKDNVDEGQDLEKASNSSTDHQHLIPSKTRTFAPRKVARHAISFTIILAIMTMVLPKSLLLNSTSTIYSTPRITIKSDHLFWSISSIFISTAISTVSASAQYRKTCSFAFTGYCIILYQGLIVMATHGQMFLFHDMVLNMLSSIAHLASQDYKFEDHNINVFTSMLMSFFSHINESDCLHRLCGQSEQVEAMVKDLIYFRHVFGNCLTVMSASGFVLLPLILWIILVESTTYEYT